MTFSDAYPATAPRVRTSRWASLSSCWASTIVRCAPCSAGAVGVYVKKAAPGAKAGVAGAEHCVEGMDGVRDAVEEINGVSWRSDAAG